MDFIFSKEYGYYLLSLVIFVCVVLGVVFLYYWIDYRIRLKNKKKCAKNEKEIDPLSTDNVSGNMVDHFEESE